MAKISRNRLKRIVDIQDITLKYKKQGVTQKFIFENYIYPVYFITEVTYYRYLGTNAKLLLRKLEKEDTK
jgi:hypothetical protein